MPKAWESRSFGVYNSGVAKKFLHGSPYLLPTAFLLLVGFAFLLSGSFLDLEVSAALYEEDAVLTTILGIVLPLPFYALFGLAGAASGVAFGHRNSHLQPFASILITLLFGAAGGFLFGYFTIGSYIDDLALAIGVGVFAIAIIGLSFLYAIFDVDEGKAFRIAMIVFLNVLFSVLFALFLALAARRATYEAVLRGGEGLFRPWYSFNPEAALPYEGASGRQLWSFPSLALIGLSSSAVYVRVLPFFEFDERKGGWIVTATVFLFSLLLAYGEIASGHCYLSDVGFSLILGSIIGLTFPFLVPDRSNVRKKTRKSPLNAEILRSRKKLALAERDENSIRIKRRDARIKAVIPLEELPPYSTRRNSRRRR